jgi:hypothetical protein
LAKDHKTLSKIVHAFRRLAPKSIDKAVRDNSGSELSYECPKGWNGPMNTSSDCGSTASWRALQEIVEITTAESDTRKNERQPVTLQESELLRHGVEAQLRWALAHGGDQELIDLLRDQRDRFL